MEIIRRKVLLVLIFIAVFFVVLIFILLVLDFYVNSQVKSLEGVLTEKDQELKGAQFQVYKDITQETNKVLGQINNFWQSGILFTPLIEKISLLTGKKIYLTNLSFKRDSKEINVGTADSPVKKKIFWIEVSIAGVAKNRETLFLFKKSLEAESVFKNVYFSPSSWMKPIDAAFSLTLEIPI